MARTKTKTQARTVKRAAIYLRQSSTDVGTVSLEAQRKACIAFCESQGWEVIEIYTEADTSGRAGTNRPQFDLLDAAASDYDVVVSWKLDRLTRGGIVEFAKIVHTWRDKHATYYASVMEPEVNTAAGSQIAELIMMILAHFAQMESDNIKARVRDSRDMMRSQGRWTSSKAPFGHSVHEWIEDGQIKRELRVVESEAEFLRTVVDMIIKGMTISDAARWMTKQPIKTRSGRSNFSRNAVTDLMRSPSLAGWMSHDDEWDVKGQRDRKIEPLLGDDNEPIVCGEGVISGGKWRELQDVLDARATNGVKRRKHTPMLGGLVKCVHCGSKMQKAGNPKYYGYQCASSNARPGTCPGNSTSMAKTDAVVKGLVREWIPGAMAHGREVRAQKAANEDTSGAEMERLRQGIKQQSEDIAEARDEGASEYLITQKKAALRKSDLRLQELQAASDARTASTQWGRIMGLLDGPDPQAAFDELGDDDVRAVVQFLTESVTIKLRQGTGKAFQPERIDVDLALPA